MTTLQARGTQITDYDFAPRPSPGSSPEAIAAAAALLPGGGLLRLSRHLYYVLINTLSGPSMTLLRSVHTSNGFEAWRRLHQRDGIPSATKNYV